MPSFLAALLLLLLACVHSTSAFTVAPTSIRMYSLESSAEDTAASSEEPPAPPVPCPDCDLCDGSGRILGGLGAILPMFPVKAYRPCPNFIERGGDYRRSGQGLDEIAFGRDSTFEK